MKKNCLKKLLQELRAKQKNSNNTLISKNYDNYTKVESVIKIRMVTSIFTIAILIAIFRSKTNAKNNNNDDYNSMNNELMVITLQY